MVAQRTVRYYSSIPKLLLLLLGFAVFFAIGWWTWTSQQTIRDAIVGVLGLGFGGLGALVFLLQLVFTVFIRKPLLEVSDTGITSSSPLSPWRRFTIPWHDVAGISIWAQQLRGNGPVRNTQHYFVVHARRPDLYRSTSSRLARMSAAMYPTLATAPIVVSIKAFFLRTTRKRRAQILERIKTTFAPEIIQYNVIVDDSEQPL